MTFWIYCNNFNTQINLNFFPLELQWWIICRRFCWIEKKWKSYVLWDSAEAEVSLVTVISITAILFYSLFMKLFYIMNSIYYKVLSFFAKITETYRFYKGKNRTNGEQKDLSEDPREEPPTASSLIQYNF